VEFWSNPGDLADLVYKVRKHMVDGKSALGTDWVNVMQALRQLQRRVGLPDDIWLTMGGAVRVVDAVRVAVAEGRVLRGDVAVPQRHRRSCAPS
jgi:hypothetical protein